MSIKTVKLLDGAFDIKISEIADGVTLISFLCPEWKTKRCIYGVAGKWKINSINRNLVTLINHNEIINDHDNANSGKSI